jgi:probable F420-dependent oxidoreductase
LLVVTTTGQTTTGLAARGLTFASFAALGIDAGVAAAGWARELRYRSFFVAETVGGEAFATLAAVGAAEPDLDLGTGVLALQLRTPMLAAMGAATLQSLHPDRDIVLGVGISSPVVTGQWHGVPYGERPVAHAREYLTLVRQCLDGDAVTFDGDFYSVRRFRLGVTLGDRRPKLVLGALNARMLRLAGELADGVLLNYLPASHVPWAIEQVRAGEAATGNRCTIYGYVHLGATERSERALSAARRDLFSYAVVDAYAKAFTLAGFGDEVAEVRERHAAKDRDGAIGAVSDRMVDAINVIGDAATVQAAVRSYVDAGVEVPIVMPLPWGGDRLGVVRDTMQAVADA